MCPLLEMWVKICLEGEGLGVRAGPAALKSKWYQGDLEP